MRSFPHFHPLLVIAAGGAISPTPKNSRGKKRGLQEFLDDVFSTRSSPVFRILERPILFFFLFFLNTSWKAKPSCFLAATDASAIRLIRCSERFILVMD